MQALVSDRDPLTKSRTRLQQYASERLIREIDHIRGGPDGLDGDYFLDAQDFDKDWARNITISAPEMKGARATVEVELKGKEVGVRKLHVTLVQERGRWKVDKVEGR